MGDSEKKLRDVFSQARLAAPCILFLDNIENLAQVRGQDSSEEKYAVDEKWNKKRIVIMKTPAYLIIILLLERSTDCWVACWQSLTVFIAM